MGLFDGGSGVLGSIGSIVGGVIGQANAAGDLGDARNEQVIANNIIQSIQNAPDIQKPLLLQQYKQQGLLTPAMEQAINLGTSKESQVQTDQSSLDAQKAALQQLTQRSQGGLTPTDRAALNQIISQVGAQTQGQRGAILQQIQSQTGGVGMTGNRLAAQLSAAQGGSNQASSMADQVMSQASQNALNAAVQSGQLGGQINNQQFGQNMAKAQAADQFSRFNVQNQQAVQNTNTAAQNTANQYNTTQAQNLSNANTTMQNQEYYNQLQRQMQEYNANVNTAALKAGQAQGYGNYLQNQGQKTAQAGANMGAGIGSILNAGVSAAAGAPSTGGAGGFAGADPMAGATMVAAHGAVVPEMHNFKQGGQVPGHAVMPGDHPANDTVHAMLSPGEIVLPRTMAKSPIGKRLAKLLEDHHQLRKDMGE